MEMFHVFALMLLVLCSVAFFAPIPYDWKVIFPGGLLGFFLFVRCQEDVRREAR